MDKKTTEERVGMLLKHPDDFAWAFKPADSRMYGGQTRIDWIACDKAGRCWLVEVKQVDPEARSINLLNEVSPGQRNALTSVSRTTVGIALLAVWQGTTLYIFDWSRVLWHWQKRSEQHEPSHLNNPALLPLESASLVIEWTGPKAWATVRLLPFVEEFWAYGPHAAIPPTRVVPERPSPKPASLRSTLRLRGCTPTPDRMLRLVP